MTLPPDVPPELVPVARDAVAALRAAHKGDELTLARIFERYSGDPKMLQGAFFAVAFALSGLAAEGYNNTPEAVLDMYEQRLAGEI